MLNPEETAKMDQAAAALVEFFPPTMKRLYDSFLEEGFTKAQAEHFVNTWLWTTANPNPGHPD